MILVADSGSSKTDWMGYKNGQVYQFNTPGINPYFVNENEIQKILSKNVNFAEHAEEVKEIYFFGAGCSSPDKHEIVSNGLSSFFKHAYVAVDHDLYGCAFATCGSESGINCILGTGSNICFFDGEQLQTGNQGLGYVLGDEGSGTFFGKKILLSYMHGKMPKHLHEDFSKNYHTNKSEIIANIYQRAFPNTYLANFSLFMHKHIEDPFIQEILRAGFQEFIDTHIKEYKNYKDIPCHFVGSIAFYYQDFLLEQCEKNKVKVGKILRKPIEELFKYILHREGLMLTAN